MHESLFLIQSTEKTARRSSFHRRAGLTLKVLRPLLIDTKIASVDNFSLTFRPYVFPF